MKTKFLPASVALCGSLLLAMPSWGQSSASRPGEKPKAGSAADPGLAGRAEPQAETVAGTPVSTPPPAPPADAAKPNNEPPSTKHVWVPGYYKPVSDKWTWVAGSWEVPPTAESIWIEGTYNQRTKRWNQGHWQPDVPTHPSPRS